MRKTGIMFLGVFLLAVSASPGWAATYTLFDWAFNVDGTLAEYFGGDAMPVAGTLTDGLGTLTWTTNDAGNHNFIAFFDYEIDEEVNTFFNETGANNGVLAAGQSWEIDEPGWGSEGYVGDIYGHVLAGSLDNSNGLPGPNDVSTALGWNFVLAEGETALITLFIMDEMPASGFYLQQFDPDSNASIYLASTVEIQPIPIPETLLLLGSGVLGLFGFRRRLWK